MSDESNKKFGIAKMSQSDLDDMRLSHETPWPLTPEQVAWIEAYADELEAEMNEKAE